MIYAVAYFLYRRGWFLRVVTRSLLDRKVD